MFKLPIPTRLTDYLGEAVVWTVICVERLLHIGSHFSLRKWRRRPHFPTKLAAASFSNKIGGVAKDLATLLAAVLTWSGYWLPHLYKRREPSRRKNKEFK